MQLTCARRIDGYGYGQPAEGLGVYELGQVRVSQNSLDDCVSVRLDVNFWFTRAQGKQKNYASGLHVRITAFSGLTPELSRTDLRRRQSHNPKGLCRRREAVSA